MSNSTGDKLRAAATGQVAKREETSFPALLKQYGSQIAAALPKHMTADRMTRIALTAFRGNPRLADCDPKSVFACVVMSSQLGLEVGVMGHAFLVPYKQRDGSYICNLVPGWRGLQDLANRSGRASTWTAAVFEGDDFKYEFGSSPSIHHVPCGEDRVEKLTHVYAVGRIKGAEYPIIEVWSKLKVERHRNRYNRQGNRHYSYEHFEQYGRKVALLQVLKYMPASVEMAAALGLDMAAEVGVQSLDIKDAIDGNYLPPPAELIGHDDAKTEDDLESTSAANLQSATTIEELNAAWTTIKTTYDGISTVVPVSLEPIFNARREAIKTEIAEAAKKYAAVKG